MTEQQKPATKDEDDLDEALDESFPASDPPAPVREPNRDQDKKIDDGEADEPAKRAPGK